MIQLSNQCLNIFRNSDGLSTILQYKNMTKSTHQLILQQTEALLVTSGSFLAEILVNSPWKSFIFIIYGNVFWIKVSKQYLILL